MGAPPRIHLLHKLTISTLTLLCPPGTSVDGAVGEEEGSSVEVRMMVLGSAVVGTTFSLAGDGMTLASNLASATFVG